MTATGWGRAPVAQTILAVKEDGWQTMLVDSFLREWSNVQASTADLKQLSGLALLRQLLPNEFARQALELAPPLPEAEAEPEKHRISPECLSKLEAHVERMVSNAFALLEKKMVEAEPGEVGALYDHIDRGDEYGRGLQPVHGIPAPGPCATSGSTVAGDKVARSVGHAAQRLSRSVPAAQRPAMHSS